jgi:hypothetical protein
MYGYISYIYVYFVIYIGYMRKYCDCQNLYLSKETDLHVYSTGLQKVLCLYIYIERERVSE